MIVASFTSQYGLRISDIKEMRWSEFVTLLIGIGPDTILGRIVSIRAEKDKDVLKNFTKEQHRIRNEWKKHHSVKTMSESEAEKEMKNISRAFAQMVGVNI